MSMRLISSRVLLGTLGGVFLIGTAMASFAPRRPDDSSTRTWTSNLQRMDEANRQLCKVECPAGIRADMEVHFALQTLNDVAIDNTFLQHIFQVTGVVCADQFIE